MGQLEELSVELGCVCEVADRDGLSGYCGYPAAYYDPEANETEPIYLCENHRPGDDVYTIFSYA